MLAAEARWLRHLPTLILLAGAVISLLPLLALAVHAFPSADDYCLAVEVRRGFWQMQLVSYLHWTGRYTSTFLQAILSQWDLAGMYPWFCLATLGAMFLASRTVMAALVERVSRSGLTIAAAVAVVVFVGKLPSLTESFFWMASATTYRWGLIVYFVWLTLLIRIVKHDGSAPAASRVATAVLTVVLPGFNETMAPIVLATIGGFAVVSRRRKLESDRFMLMLSVVAVVCTVVLLAAPGNAIRSGSYPDIPTRHNLSFALVETGRQAGRFFLNFGAHPALWVAACAAWWWGPRGLASSIVARAGVRISVVLIVLLPALIYATLFPLYWEYGAENYTGEGRTYNITQFVLYVTIVAAVWSVLDRAAAKWSDLSARLHANRRIVDLALAACLAFLMVTSPGTRQAFAASRQAPAYLEAQQAREATLRAPQNRGRELLVDELRIKPVGLFWGDVQPDEAHWINSCVANYYGVSSVRTP